MLTLLIGLPGSGKSTWAKKHGAAGEARIYQDFLGAQKPLNEGKGLFSLLEDVRAGKTVFADDVFLCRERDRGIFGSLLGPFVHDGYQVRWVYFTNSPGVCRSNVELRNRQRPDSERRKHAFTGSTRFHRSTSSQRGPNRSRSSTTPVEATSSNLAEVIAVWPRLSAATRRRIGDVIRGDRGG